ncbi:hypothetical protein [Rhodopirellula sp. MGV]|uniref:hypothetical protein n=1 Tax=Rhodopirellula sp. MGV TaxID=2023130 RepID=UPI000B960B7D|nr:hypothetical protein [Rhodopirellula sp. MGV]OYP34976.1 hypothetical protein CGZ80_13235 [Rhodopirellula sp. MGV]PNY38128.1 hypothetical protein C2E31_03710 [Rhodopirellula baltica]
MNRFLVIPLVVSVLLFIAVLNQQSILATSEPHLASAEYRLARSDHKSSRPLMPLEEARRQILEAWPQESPEELFTRRTTFLSFSAFLDQPSELTQSHSESNFLFSLAILAHGHDQDAQEILKSRFAKPLAIHVDRESGQTFIFEQGQWHDYKTWAEEALPTIRKLTNFDV